MIALGYTGLGEQASAEAHYAECWRWTPTTWARRCTADYSTSDFQGA
jgi:hypothetical protein